MAAKHRPRGKSNRKPRPKVPLDARMDDAPAPVSADAFSGGDGGDAPAEAPDGPVPHLPPQAIALRARVTTLTDEIERALIALLERGTFIEQACAEIGLARPTFYLWLRNGKRMVNGERNPDYHPRYELFDARIQAARSRAIGLMQRTLHASALGTYVDNPTAKIDTRAAAEYLRTMDAQSIAHERSRAARLLAQRTRLEIKLLEIGGKSAAQQRADGERTATETILTALAEVLDEEQYETILRKLSGAVDGEASPSRDAAPGSGDPRGDRASEERQEGAAQGEEEGR